MARFQIDDVVLRIPGHQLVPKLRKALDSGAYEHLEARALNKVLRADDRVLELGAGCGFLAIHARQLGASVVSVEANPEMIDVIKRNFAINGVEDVTLIHGAAVATVTEPEVQFFLRGGFWAGSLDARGGAAEQKVTAPALALNDLIERHDPTALLVDVEGAEASLFDDWVPGNVRLVILEIHPRQYGRDTVAQIFQGMAKRGFVYDPTVSRGKVILFSRI